MSPRKKIPSPDELLSEVQGIESSKRYPFEDYMSVVHQLQQKDYSYAKIAAFLKERLGFEVSRGQVYRAYQIWLEEARLADERAREGEEQARMAEAFLPPPSLHDEYDQRLQEEADELMQRLREQEERGGNEPWNDAEAILARAYHTMVARREAAEAAEKAAAEADEQLESKKKRGSNAPTK